MLEFGALACLCWPPCVPTHGRQPGCVLSAGSQRTGGDFIASTNYLHASFVLNGLMF